MPFRYLRDPLFLFCLVLYFVNRLVLKPLTPNWFLHGYLNDVICIPFWVPIMLWFMRKAGMRADDAPPRGYEVLIPILLWSFVFEVWLPRAANFGRWAVSDPADILCYILGAQAALLFWQWCYSRPSRTSARPVVDPASGE
jgi:hypothetical protein